MKVDTAVPTPRNRNRASEDIQFVIATSSFGLVLVARSAKGICAVLFGNDHRALQRDLRRRFPDAALTDGEGTLGALAAEVIAFVDSPRRGFDVPLDMRGTAFQRTVWQALREIPAGSTASYSDIASRIGAPTAAKEVAEACAANALAVIVPCHRVVKKDGSVSGYRWGVERKRALLAREAMP
jgi:AraC family transcriptional regulator, regulatory protein of adaptative response / methylated-DNA-[protein]-cysteine methyltransferase